MGEDWHPENFSRKYPYLKKRAALIKAVRNFFDEQNFDEVDTPALQISPGMEPHLKAFKTDLINPEQDQARTLYLHTSPEFAMKKLLVAGVPKLYQICHVFRNAEGSHLHSPEFSMIEWYRAYAGYEQIMYDCEALLKHCANTSGITHYRYKNRQCDPFAGCDRLSVIEAYKKYSGIDVSPDSTSEEWEELFYKVFLNDIEPHLGADRPLILYDYPACMAALSRKKPDDPRFAERFELYVCGVELANAFGELTDAQEQRQRFEQDMDLKEELYGERYPVDEDFLDALEYGLPECAGIALGIDRLVMLTTGAEHINDVLWNPVVKP